MNALYAFTRVCVLIVETVQWTFFAPLRGKGLRVRSTFEQFVEFGVNSLPIVCLITFLIGAIMAMQSSYQLARFGATRYIANLVGVAALRELAPLMDLVELREIRFDGTVVDGRDERPLAWSALFRRKQPAT